MTDRCGYLRYIMMYIATMIPCEGDVMIAYPCFLRF